MLDCLVSLKVKIMIKVNFLNICEIYLFVCLGHHERPPFQGSNLLKSVYHVRSADIFRLKQLKSRGN